MKGATLQLWPHKYKVSWEYYEHQQTGHLKDIDKFLEKNNLQKLNHEKIENLNRPTTGKGIELVIKNTPTNKSPDQMVSLVNSIKHLNWDLNQSFSNFFKK